MLAANGEMVKTDWFKKVEHSIAPSRRYIMVATDIKAKTIFI